MGGESPSGSTGGQTNRNRGAQPVDPNTTGGRGVEFSESDEERSTSAPGSGGPAGVRDAPSGLDMQLQPQRTERDQSRVIRLLGQARPQVADGTRVVTPGAGAGAGAGATAREDVVRSTAAARRRFRPQIGNLFGGRFGQGFRLLGGVENEVLG